MIDGEDREAFEPPHPLIDLSHTGLLWLINRAVFHPRGFALALSVDDNGDATGWRLFGDGSEVWHYAASALEDGKFAAAEATFTAASRARTAHPSSGSLVLNDREAELRELKGPCSDNECRPHYAHRGPHDIRPDGEG